MLEYQSVDELSKAAINANLEAIAPPCRLKGLERASRWVARAYEESHGTSGLTLQSLEEIYGSLFHLFDAGGIARSTSRRSCSQRNAKLGQRIRRSRLPTSHYANFSLAL